MYSSGDSPVGHRKHFYKQGLAVGRNVHEQNEVRKSKREKSFAVKRQQFLLEAAADSPNERASIEALCTFTPLQIAEAVSALQTAAAAVVSARGGSLPVATGSTMDAVWAQWESAKSGMPALSGSSVLGYGMATLGGASSAILGLRRILAIYSPPCAEVIRCGALLPMVALLNSKLRQTTGELLWVVAYCISSIANNPEQFDVIFLQQLFQLTPALSNILLQLLQYTSVDHESRPATPQLTSSPNEWTVNSSPSPEAKYAVDLITPILEFLRYAVVLSGPADIFGGVISTADRLVASEDMHLVLNIGLSHSHRGVQRGMCEIAATLAAAAQPHTKYVLLHLQPLAKLLSSTAGCDVKRETATAITHLALNHDGKFFNFVMAVEPRVVDSLMSTLQKCKTDELFVLVALDFLELALNRWPRARWYMYEQGIVEILEDVHPSQGEALYERIAAMLRQHFDDVEIASLDEAREAEFNAELQLSRQILLNEKWSDV
eukprot:Lankesteria_metandrocarpae@DN1166_c0_g1_i3.p1